MFITDHNKIISYYPTISVIRLFSLVGCLFYFADQWVFSLSVAAYNHSVVATVCWNAVTSVKNISSCGPQKSTVIVSFLWSTVRCLLRTDRNKKVKPPVSHAPISKETVFRKIHFILPMKKPSLNVSQKELFTSCVAFARHTLFSVLWNRSRR